MKKTLAPGKPPVHPVGIMYSLGIDYGTESVRVLLVSVKDGGIAAQAACPYAHGVIAGQLPTGEPLDGDDALQHPQDWLDAMTSAVKEVLNAVPGAEVIGIGVDFTSCTMLPTLSDGTPLCLLPAFARQPHAWSKLWKHHGAKTQTDRINAIARERNEPFLNRYGGVIGLEWFFPKILETLQRAPHVYNAASVFLEAGDWLVWQLTDGPFPDCAAQRLSRSTCQAGYKAMWGAEDGFPSRDYFSAVEPGLTNVLEKLPGTPAAPGRRCGGLSAGMAPRLGLPVGTPVSAAIIDAHAGVPGAGVCESGTLVMVMGTSSCHMLLSNVNQPVGGVAGRVVDGILPGFVGYETGQAAVGDGFAWAARVFGKSHDELSRDAALLSPGSGGVMALDWLNGCRTPLMDGRLSGLFTGMTLATTPPQMYRALLEASGFGVRWIVETLRNAGVPVERFVASGGLPAKSPLLMQIYADILNAPIHLAQSEQSVALGAAILGCLAAGERSGYPGIALAVKAMARQREDLVYRPRAEAAARYHSLYTVYRNLADDEALRAAMYALRG